jgi:O-antigen ligase
VAVGYTGFMLVTRLRGQTLSLRRRAALVAVTLIVPALAGTVLWASRERIQTDINTLEAAHTLGYLSYASSQGEESSLGTRLNLYRIGVQLFAARPLLGWGPGTTGTKDLVPAEVIPLTQYDLDNAPKWAHLHSVAIELLVRFGLLGAALAFAFLAVMRGAYGRLQTAAPDRPLAHFFLLGGILTLLYCVYDFRLIHVDMQFFVILLCGIGYRFRRRGPSDLRGALADLEHGSG